MSGADSRMHPGPDDAEGRGASNDSSGRNGAARIALGAIAFVAALLLLAEHRAHVVPYLPWLILAACPLLHYFHHAGHRRHRHSAAAAPDAPAGEDRVRTAAPGRRTPSDDAQPGGDDPR